MKRAILLFIVICFASTVFAQPKTADENYAEGVKLVNQEKLTEALSFFNKAINLNSKHYNAFTQAGIILVRMQNKADALTCLKTAVKLKKDNVLAYNWLGVLYKNVIGKPDSALFFFKKLVQYSADTSAESNYNIAWSFNALQKEDSAIKYLKKTLEINNNYKPAYKELAYSYHKLKKYKEAIEQFNKNLAVSVNDLPIYYLGLIYLETNEVNKAIEKQTELKAINAKMGASLQKKIDAKLKPVLPQ